MNFYKHHIGDYAQATAHLSFVEDAAYSRLLRKYYAEEAPLPADLKAVQRLVGARTREERAAVETVLREFFTAEADGWHNKRADAEISKASAQADTNRRIAEEREARRRVNGTSTNRAPHVHGTSTNRAPHVHESFNDSSRSREPSQTPDSRHQTPDTRERGSPSGDPPARAPRTRKASPRSRRAPVDFAPDRERALGLLPGVDLDAEIEKFRRWEFKTPRSDWPATWSNWVDRCAETGRYARLNGQRFTRKTADELEAEARARGEDPYAAH